MESGSTSDPLGRSLEGLPRSAYHGAPRPELGSKLAGMRVNSGPADPPLSPSASPTRGLQEPIRFQEPWSTERPVEAFRPKPPQAPRPPQGVSPRGSCPQNKPRDQRPAANHVEEPVASSMPISSTRRHEIEERHEPARQPGGEPSFRESIIVASPPFLEPVSSTLSTEEASPRSGGDAAEGFQFPASPPAAFSFPSPFLLRSSGGQSSGEPSAVKLKAGSVMYPAQGSPLDDEYGELAEEHYSTEDLEFYARGEPTHGIQGEDGLYGQGVPRDYPGGGYGMVEGYGEYVQEGGGDDVYGPPSVSSTSSSSFSKGGPRTRLQAAELLVQIEAMIASGPHGKLDEYLPVVELLLGVKKLLAQEQEQVGVGEGGGVDPQSDAEVLAEAEKLFRTAMDDLEFEFREILKFRCTQASQRFKPSHLESLYKEFFLLPRQVEGRKQHEEQQRQREREKEKAQTGEEGETGSGRKGETWDESFFSHTSSNQDNADVTEKAKSGSGKKLPGDSIANGSEAARGGSERAGPTLAGADLSADPAGGKSKSMAHHRRTDSSMNRTKSAKGPVELVPSSSVKWLNQCILAMDKGDASERCLAVYKSIRTEALKESLAALDCEKRIKVANIPGMSWPQLEKTTKNWVQLAYIVGGVLLGMERRLAAGMWRGLEAQRRPGLRSVLLDSGLCLRILFLVEALRAIAGKNMPEQLFSLLDAYQVVDDITAEMEATIGDLRLDAVWDIWQGLPSLLARAVANTLGRFRKRLEDLTNFPTPSPRRPARSLSKRLLNRTHSTEEDEDPAIFEHVPRDGGVHPVTSYVANYIRSYLERVGQWNYIETLQELFQLLEGEEAPYNERSMEGETAQMVLALRANLEARSKLYRSEALQQLFLMNNVNYLVKSISQWHGWRSQSLERISSKTRRDGSKNLMMAIADLQDQRVVHNYAAAFQSLALMKVLHVLGVELGAEGSCVPPEAIAEITTLKKFNSAFEELQKRQQPWRIPDPELRRWVKDRWAMTLQERYRKALLPNWDLLTTCKFYVYTPENVANTIAETFFAKEEESR